MIPESANSLLHSQALAHVSTIDPDGRPQVTCAWVGLKGTRSCLVKFPAMDDPPPGYVTRITVEKISGVGPWA